MVAGALSDSGGRIPDLETAASIAGKDNKYCRGWFVSFGSREFSPYSQWLS